MQQQLQELLGFQQLQQLQLLYLIFQQQQQQQQQQHQQQNSSSHAFGELEEDPVDLSVQQEREHHLLLQTANQLSAAAAAAAAANAADHLSQRSANSSPTTPPQQQLQPHSPHSGQAPQHPPPSTAIASLLAVAAQAALSQQQAAAAAVAAGGNPNQVRAGQTTGTEQTQLQEAAANARQQQAQCNHHRHHHHLAPLGGHHHHSSIQTQQQLLATQGFNPLAVVAGSGQQTEILTPTHLRKAKLMFFYVRYPNSSTLRECFRDVRFNKNNTAQLVKWFSNFREFYYIQMEKFARDAVADDRILCKEDIQVSYDHDLINQLNNHYNKNRHIELPEVFRAVVEETLRHFFDAIYNKRDQEQSWKKAIYKLIARLDQEVPEVFKHESFNEHLE